MLVSLFGVTEHNDASSNARLLQNLKDYTSVSFSMLWQRQAIFLASSLLTGYYFDPINALIFYCVTIFCEVQDVAIARRVARLHVNQRQAISTALYWVLQNTILSAGAICIYAVSVALKQQTGGHFTPLFFLFAAALFAAMNNHQLLLVLTARLSMYGLSFLIIVFADIMIERPPLDSDIWLQFFTTVFVMYFLIDCSIVFMRLYRKNLAQLEALREEHENTKAAYIAKSQFVSTVSHELRTPLTSIKGSIDLVNSGALGDVPESMKSLLDMAGKNSVRLSRLINDLLDLQKIEAGELRYKFETLSVFALVTEAVNSNVGYANSHDVTIVQMGGYDDDALIRGDEARLMQVMANMISNAVKFSNTGGVVRVGYRRDGDKVKIFVEDDGIGIPEGSKEKVFGRFTQLDSSDRRRAMGSGLGLSISREIVERLGGSIDYESRVGFGTVFFVEFPVCDEAEAAVPHTELRERIA